MGTVALVTKHSFFFSKCGPHEVSGLVCTPVFTFLCLTDSRVQQRSRKTFRKSNFLAWAKGRWGQDGVSSRRKKYRVFGAPLDTIIINEQLPEILQVGFEFLVLIFCYYNKDNIKDIYSILVLYICVCCEYTCVCAHQSFCLYVCVMNVLVHMCTPGLIS